MHTKAKLGCDADHSPTSNAEVNNEELYFQYDVSAKVLLCKTMA